MSSFAAQIIQGDGIYNGVRNGWNRSLSCPGGTISVDIRKVFLLLL